MKEPIPSAQNWRDLGQGWEQHPAMNYWLVKQEPEDYSWEKFCKDGLTAWTGVRNFEARNNLRAMKKGELVLYYHTGDEKQVVGIARVQKEAYTDPTATEGDWSAVDLKPVKGLKTSVTLSRIKSDKVLKDMPLVRKTRLSVVPVSEEQFSRLVGLGETEI